jgi:4-hydroxybenzoate polyprenyltransferase
LRDEAEHKGDSEAFGLGARRCRDAKGVTVVELPRRFASLVKIEHTIFALPFAYVGAFLAVDGVPSAHDLVWVTLAMVGARSLAMALNRLIDAGLDARNPRTAGRELPAGRLSVVQVLVFCAASLALFLVAVWQLDPLVRWLWPIPVVAFVVYPYLKRFTWTAHLWLGAIDGLAPVGAWVAIRGDAPWQAWALGAAVAVWVAGFDLFYSLFDEAVDRAQGLHSWTVRWGVRGTFWGARALHGATVGALVAAGLGLPVGALYWVGVGVVAALLAYEHSLVRPGDLRRLDAAFFTTNGVISLAFFAFVLADVL